MSLPDSPKNIDIDALADELTTAGYAVEITRGAIGTRALNCEDWVVRDWTLTVTPPCSLGPTRWAIGDIIRKHVEAV